MSDVVDLRPARSVEFEGELEEMANRLSLALYEALAMLEVVGPGHESFSRLSRLKGRIVRAMNTIYDHISCIEEEMDRIFDEIEDGIVITFQTYDMNIN